MAFEEIPEGQKTIQFRDGQIITSTHSRGGVRHYDAFDLDRVKMPAGKRLAIVSDDPEVRPIQKAE